MKKIFKHVILARSGIYPYTAAEMANLGLDLKDAPEKKDIYYVYRPATVLIRDKEKFVNLPVTFRHPREFLTNENFQKYIVGYTSNEIDIEVLESSDEVALKSSLSLIDDGAITAYESGVDQVSPGYYAAFAWQKGTTEKGQDYDIVMTEVKEDANHLALVEKARGGDEVKIIDEMGGNTMPNFLSGIWRALRRMTKGVKDSDMGAFKTSLEEVIKNRSSLKDEELAAKIEGLKSFIADLPESDGKAQLVKIITDLPSQIKSLDETSAQTLMTGMVDLFQRLDSEAMKDADILKKDPPADNATVQAPAAPVEKPKDTAPVTTPETGTPATIPNGVKDVTFTPEQSQYIIQEIAKLLKIEGVPVDAAKPPVTTEPVKPVDADTEVIKPKNNAPEPEKDKTNGAADSMHSVTIDNKQSGIDPVEKKFNDKKRRW